MYLSYSQIKKREIFKLRAERRTETSVWPSCIDRPGRYRHGRGGVLTELVSYMYPIYVHYMYILDVLSFPFGSRHWPYWDCEVRSKSEWRVSCIAPTVLWLFYNTDHNRQIYRGHIPWHFHFQLGSSQLDWGNSYGECSAKPCSLKAMFRCIRLVTVLSASYQISSGSSPVMWLQSGWDPSSVESSSFQSGLWYCPCCPCCRRHPQMRRKIIMAKLNTKEGATAQLEKFKPIPAKLLATWAWQQADNPNITWQFELIALECPAGLPSNAKLAGAFANCRKLPGVSNLIFSLKALKVAGRVIFALKPWNPDLVLWKKSNNQSIVCVWCIHFLECYSMCIYIYIIYLLYKFIRFLCILPLSFGLEECRIFRRGAGVSFCDGFGPNGFWLGNCLDLVGTKASKILETMLSVRILHEPSHNISLCVLLWLLPEGSISVLEGDYMISEKRFRNARYLIFQLQSS